MLTAQDLKKGVILVRNGEPWLVADVTRSKMAQRELMVKAKLKSLKKGNTLEVTHRSDDPIEEADVTKKSLKYLYKDNTSYYFMDDKFEQYEVMAEGLQEKSVYLVEDASVDGIFWNDQLYDIILPKKLIFKVISSPPGVKGDSATSGTKPATIETGATVQVPLFVDEGDKIAINTETGQYVERVNG